MFCWKILFRLWIINTFAGMYFHPKQGLWWAWKLRQCTNWNENLWICELAMASNKKNLSVQLVRLDGPSSWSIQLVWLADPSTWSIHLIHLAELSCWLYSYCTMHIIISKVHMLQSGHGAKWTCYKVDVLPMRAHTEKTHTRCWTNSALWYFFCGGEFWRE